MKTLLIGDVHGLTTSYHRILEEYQPDASVQIGDFGFRTQHEWHRQHIDAAKHKVLFGNHDDPSCLNMAHSLGNFGYDHRGFFYVRGADSYDKDYRIEGVSWWADEQLDTGAFAVAIETYDTLRPRIVLSHDCPQSVRRNRFGINQTSRTSQALEVMLKIHRPDLWVFGHHHLSVDEVVDGTRFICLDELETMWL